jgi:hypothetical protein
MKRISHRIFRIVCFVAVSCLGIVVLSGCAVYDYIGNLPGETQQPGNGRAPTLSKLSVSPNPTCGGSVVNLTAAYIDPDADLEFGTAAVFVNGEHLSRVAFRATYVSGTLTIPLAVSYYTRPSDLQLTLMIRDSAGNWSNSVSTNLSIR